MKSLAKTILAAAATFCMTYVALAEEPTKNVPTTKSFAVGVFASQNAEKLNVTIENYANKTLTVKLKDENGATVYTETVNKTTPKYWRKFDVSQIGSENCSVEVSDGTETISKDLNSTTRNITASTQPTDNQDLAVGMYQIENTMKMNLSVNNKRNTALQITLKNADGEELYSEIVGKKYPAYKRAFDLAGLADGSYQFEISNGRTSIVKEISVNTQK